MAARQLKGSKKITRTCVIHNFSDFGLISLNFFLLFFFVCLFVFPDFQKRKEKKYIIEELGLGDHTGVQMPDGAHRQFFGKQSLKPKDE